MWCFTDIASRAGFLLSSSAIRNVNVPMKNISLSPDFSLAHYHKGIALLLVGRPAEAVSLLSQEPREDWRLTGLTMALFERDRQIPDAAEASKASDKVLDELLEKYSENMTFVR